MVLRAGVTRYTEFRIQWEIVENQMTQLSFPDARKLIELKRALEGDALEKIERLPLEDANYEKAVSFKKKFPCEKSAFALFGPGEVPLDPKSDR